MPGHDITEPQDMIAPMLAQLRAEIHNTQTLLAAQRDALAEKGLTLPPGISLSLRQMERTLMEALQEVRYQARSQAQLRALAGIGKAINSSLEIDAVLAQVMDTIIQMTGAERGFLMLRNADGGLEYKTARNINQEQLEQDDFTISRTVVENVAQTGEAVVTTNAQLDPRFGGQESVLSYRLLSILCVPLRVRDKVTGVIYADNRIKEGLFTPGDRDMLAAFADQAGVAIENARLFGALEESYDQTLLGWARALELRDYETGGHSARVTDLTVRLARTMGLAASEIVHIRRGALLHDVGKMAIPDYILRKPGALTDEERAIMQQHPAHAEAMLREIAFLAPALDIPRYHHEKWDGSGYPYGLREAQIPLSARMFAIVDVWDALCYPRVYRDAWPRETVIAHMKSLAGAHFDPAVLAVFLERVMAD